MIRHVVKRDFETLVVQPQYPLQILFVLTGPATDFRYTMSSDWPDNLGSS